MPVRFETILVLSVALASSCDPKEQQLAPTASALEPAKPAAAAASPFSVEPASSKVTFSMEAPIEKISGEAPGSATGTLFVNIADVTKTTGLVKIDLDKLVLYQEKRDDESKAFGARTKNETQNQHARTWLEISPDTPADVREANRFVEFSIRKIEDASATNVLALAGAERKLTATVVGDLRLHGRKKEQRARVELAFQLAGDKAKSVRVRTIEPLTVALEEYDVHPREAFGKLAQKTLSALGSKVAKAAPVQLELTLEPE
jgi:polyisoprenoid-binding protein YceI